MSASTTHTSTTPFKRHLSYYDRDGDGFIYFGESLRANLSLGLDFPVAFVGAFGLQCWYGNTCPFIFGPLRGIEITRVEDERTMLENIHEASLGMAGLDRSSLVEASESRTYIDRMHVRGIWALAADKNGKMLPNDIRRCQQGLLLFDLEKRRRDRSDVLPLRRGGPISVAGHSWFVEKLFGVKVYQKSTKPSKTR